MKIVLVLTTMSLMLASLIFAAGVPTTVTYIPHDKVTATMAKGGQIIEDKGGLRVLAQRRGTGEVEVHKKTNHVFIIVDGEADFVTGGKMIEPKEISPGQIRGKGIEGGTVHRLSKGDVITIPAKTPHWWKDTSKTGSVGYYAVNIEQD